MNRITISAILLGLILFVTTGCIPDSGPETVVDDFFKSAKAGDMPKMKSCCTGPMLEFWELLEEMQEMDFPGVDQMDIGAELRDAKEIKIDVKEISGDTAKVDVTIKGDTITYVLSRTGGNELSSDRDIGEGCLALIFNRTRGKWLISDLETPAGTLSSMLPELKEAIEMLKNMPEIPEMPDIPEMPEEDGDD